MNFGHFVDFFPKNRHNNYKNSIVIKFIQAGETYMGKVEENKKQKKNTLFQTAFKLFTEKGFARTTISDIVNEAGLAKGTFYLYFKDKYDLRDKLITDKAEQLFSDAYLALEEKDGEVKSFEEEMIFITDYIIQRFQNDHTLMQFVAKNLSWGIFKDAVSNTDLLSATQFYKHYLQSLEQYHIQCRSPELLLFTIIELTGSTSYNCILLGQPVSMEEYLPYLHASMRQILKVFIE